MIVLVDPNDSRAVRNKDNVLSFYDLVINKKKSAEFVDQFMTPVTSSITRFIADAAKARGSSSARSPSERANARVVVDRSSPSATIVAHVIS